MKFMQFTIEKNTVMGMHKIGGCKYDKGLYSKFIYINLIY